MKNKYYGWLLLFILLKFVVQYFVNGTEYELHRDEFLHIDQGRHLAWGYHSVPPFTSWISWIILHLGNTTFWVRFVPAMFGALTIVMAWKTVIELNGKLFAMALTATAIIFSSLLRLNLLYQPNSTEVFFWTLLLFGFVKWLRTERSKWLYVAAIVFALGFLNKYNIVFLLAGIVPGLLLTPARRLFKEKHLYLACALGLLLISPNIIWQYNNGFPVIAHMNELAETQLINISRSGFLKEQFMMFIGSAIIIIAAFISFFTYREHKRYRGLFYMYVITIVLFTFFRAKGYYAYGLYPIFIAFGAVYIEAILQRGKKRWLRTIPFALIILLFIPMYRISFPNKGPEEFYEEARQGLPFSEHTWEDGKKHPISQDFADMLGWKELARKVDSIYLKVPDKEHTLIFCGNYGEAGAINFYTKIKGLRAHSFNADYINWIDLSKPVYHLILVLEAADNLPEQQKQAFNSVTVKGVITNRYAREFGTRIIYLREAKGDIRGYLKDKMKE